MATEKLDIMQTIKDGVRYGLKNFLPLLLMIILYVVTVWIPWLNVGTTIGLYKAVIGIGRGETIDPIAIFNKDNFKNVSGFFILVGLVYIGTIMAMIFMFIPAIILGIAWGFAIYFFLDKKISPLKAIQLSWDSTYGNKWRIFLVGLICWFLIGIICCILAAIPKVGSVLAVLAMLVCIAIVVAIEGVMYNFFSKKADEILAEKRGGRCCHRGEAPAEEPEEEIVPTEA